MTAKIDRNEVLRHAREVLHEECDALSELRRQYGAGSEPAHAQSIRAGHMHNALSSLMVRLGFSDEAMGAFPQ